MCFEAERALHRVAGHSDAALAVAEKINWAHEHRVANFSENLASLAALAAAQYSL